MTGYLWCIDASSVVKRNLEYFEDCKHQKIDSSLHCVGFRVLKIWQRCTADYSVWAVGQAVSKHHGAQKKEIESRKDVELVT